MMIKRTQRTLPDSSTMLCLLFFLMLKASPLYHDLVLLFTLSSLMYLYKPEDYTQV